jgi:hypothetical protein
VSPVSFETKCESTGKIADDAVEMQNHVMENGASRTTVTETEDATVIES